MEQWQQQLAYKVSRTLFKSGKNFFTSVVDTREKWFWDLKKCAYIDLKIHLFNKIKIIELHQGYTWSPLFIGQKCSVRKRCQDMPDFGPKLKNLILFHHYRSTVRKTISYDSTFDRVLTHVLAVIFRTTLSHVHEAFMYFVSLACCGGPR
jgi:hypothetical protein